MNNTKNSQNEITESLTTIRDFIDSYLRKTYTYDIVDIAKKSGLSKYIPANLSAWRNGDFYYEHDVYQFLLDVFKNESSDITQILLQNIFNEIKKFETCQRYEKGCPIPKQKHYDESYCYDCSDYVDNNGKVIFSNSIKNLGFSIDKEGFIKIIGDKPLDIAKDVEKIREKIPSENIDKLLNEDIKKKGQQMAEVYIYLYNVENCIRRFLEMALIKEIGNDWNEKISISTGIQTKIDSRKEEEKKNKWLPIRGDNIFYYMDFEELGKIIINNWEIFKKYFPNQEFIKSS